MDSYNEQCSCQQDKWYRFKGAKVQKKLQNSVLFAEKDVVSLVKMQYH